MPRTKKIDAYQHTDEERLNNPPAGLVTPDTDPDLPQKTYSYDPHLDPQLQWAGKAERLSFDVQTVSLHVHERIDPRTIIEAYRGNVSLPFELGKNRTVTVKIVDDRGIESLKVIEVEA
jgi:adenine-specific DNA-methyltransferase